jgi:hypothetical protein
MSIKKLCVLVDGEKSMLKAVETKFRRHLPKSMRGATSSTSAGQNDFVGVFARWGAEVELTKVEFKGLLTCVPTSLCVLKHLAQLHQKKSGVFYLHAAVFRGRVTLLSPC